ncbi:MAG: DUF3592 domain-containing protein [Litorimonas sp.]
MQSFFQDLLSGDRAAILNVIAGYFFLCGICGLLYWRRVRSWPQISGTLIKSEIGKLGNSMRADEQSYTAKLRYQYSVGGEEYESKRLSSIQVVASTNMRALLRWQMRYITYLDKDKNEIAVFYDPKKPQKSYLIKPLKIEPFIYAAFFILPIIFWLM